MTPRDPHEVLVDEIGDVADRIIDNAVECREAATEAELQGYSAEWLIGRSEAHMEDGEAILEMLERLTDHTRDARSQLA